MAGELLTYTLDTTKLTYNYTITVSQFGLTGKTGSGTLTNNGDGTYTPSGVTNGIVATLPNGLLLTSIRETVRGVTKTIPVMGIANPVTTLSNTTFNYVQRVCYNDPYYGYYCDSGYGTFKITTAGIWTSCWAGNLATGSCSSGYSYSGTLKSLGGGSWQVLDGYGVSVGTAVVLYSSGQQVVFLDLADTRTGGFGIGLLIGSTQQTGSSTQASGTWAYAGSDGGSGQFLVSGSQLTCLYGYCTNTGLTYNSPWAGFVTNSAGGTALLAGTGVYAYQEAGGGGYVEIGVKIE